MRSRSRPTPRAADLDRPQRNLTNADALRKEMERDGAIFQSTSDTEVILHLLARAPAGALEDQLRTRSPSEGRLLAARAHARAMYAIRIRTGSGPHAGPARRRVGGGLGDLRAGLMEAKVERDVEPGEILVIETAVRARCAPSRPREAAVRVRVRLLRAPDSALWAATSTPYARRSATSSRASIPSRPTS